MSDSSSKRHHFRDIRTRNRALLLRQLFGCGARSRQDLIKLTGLTRASVSRITKELIDEGLCYEGDFYRTDNSLGRRRVEVRINPEGATVIALCLSAFSRQIRVTDCLGNTTYERLIPAKVMSRPDSAMRFVVEYINQLLETKKISRDKIKGASIAIAGSVDPETEDLITAPLLGWKQASIRHDLSSQLGIPFRMRNIADALCLSYISRPDQQSESVQPTLFLAHTAIGMGASLAIDGQLVGRRGDEAWIEKTIVPIANSASGDVPRLGMVASGHAILSALLAENNEAPSVKRSGLALRLEKAVKASNNDQSPEQAVFTAAGTALGRSLVNLTASCRPDQIVLSGPVVMADAFCTAAEAAFRKESAGTDLEDVVITINRMTYIEAAQKIALSEYIYSGIAY